MTLHAAEVTAFQLKRPAAYLTLTQLELRAVIEQAAERGPQEWFVRLCDAEVHLAEAQAAIEGLK